MTITRIYCRFSPAGGGENRRKAPRLGHPRENNLAGEIFNRRIVERLKTKGIWLATLALLLVGCAGCSSREGNGGSQVGLPPAVQEHSLTGVIADAAMHSLLVEDSQGNRYAFSTEDAEKSGADGLLLGRPVTVWYRGALPAPGEGVAATRISQPEEQALTGQVAALWEGGLTLQTEENQQVTFGGLQRADTTLALGYGTGSFLTVWYLGDLQESALPWAYRAAYAPREVAGLPASLSLGAALQDEGIFSGYYGAALARLQGMDDAQKAGQVLLARCPQVDAAGLIATYQPGGLVLFGEDFEGRTPQEVSDTLAAYQQAAQLPLLLATDEEGGTVARVSANPQLAPQRFGSPQQVFAAGGLAALREDATAKARLLASLGLNVNLAPVADLSVDPGDYIYDRTLGQPAPETAAYVAEVVTATQQQGVGATLKHFPGYGNNRDTHTGVAVDQRERARFEQEDFLPFQAGIEAGAQGVLLSHNVVECFDSQLPASLSPAVHQLLREELGFTGVAMTDDLAMQGIRAYTGQLHPAVQALLAGNDLALLSDLASGRDAILAALQEGVLPPERLDAAVLRVLAWKMALGLNLE